MDVEGEHGKKGRERERKRGGGEQFSYVQVILLHIPQIH